MCKTNLTSLLVMISMTISTQINFLSAQTVLSFTDITNSAGTGGPTAAGQTGGHGAMFCDVDNDDHPDLYITMLFNDPMKDLFFRNTGGNVFADEGDLRGISDFDGGSHGGAFADLDNDGDYDLINGTTYSATGFPATNNIFRNDSHGFFTNVAGQGGIPIREWPTRAAIAFDMDKDGDLDLFFVTGPDGSADPPEERNEVYRNDGNLQFTAIDSGPLYTAPAGQGATDTDYDGDGNIDVFAGNRNGDVNILRNDGGGNFTLILPASIGITHQGRDGITLGDIDNDDDLDMMLASPPDAALYRSNGNGTFSLITTFANVDGYMGGFADLDNDTDMDLVFAGDPQCFLNNGSGAFLAGPAIPITGIDDPRAVAFADIDGDGDLDFAFGNKRSRNWLVRNNFNGGNWLKVKLIAPNGQAGAFGAKTRIYPAGQAGGELLGLRESRSNNGYLGQDDPVLHFGLGSHTAVEVVVRFLDGSIATRTNVSANQTLTIDASETAIERFGVFELSLSAAETYDNPYQEASVQATFVGPTGSKTIAGFWDGGDNWETRFSPDAVGNWSYSTTSNDLGLVVSGNFNCIASTRQGGIQPRPPTPLHFQYQDGTPFWWFGETCWAAFRSDASENFDSTTFREYIDVRAVQGFNYLHGNLLAGPNEGGNPFKGSMVGNEVNPAFWQEVDERVKYMNDRGVTVGMLLSWKSDKVGAGSSNPVFDFDWTDFADQDARLRYCKYIAARYSAYNVVWVLSGEYEEAASRPPNTTAHWTELANEVKSNDPHGRMMAIHGQDKVEVFADESWMSFGDYMQFYEDLHNAILVADDHGKPVINAEYAYFLRDQDSDGVVDKPNSATVEEFRHASWDIVMAGGYFVSGFGSTYLGGKREPGPFDVNASKNDPAEAQISLIKTFFSSLEWWAFQPADNLITGSGTRYCLSDFAGSYVVYIRGTTSTAQLHVVEGMASEYTLQRFDPRTGAFANLPSQTTSTTINLSTPNNQDWLFLIRRGEASDLIPIVSSFNPTSGTAGTAVTILGVNFTGTTSVKFNGVEASFTVVSDGEIHTTVPAGATTGRITVTNGFGTGNSSADFTVFSGEGGTSTFSPTDDSYVRSNRPTQNNGSTEELIVRKGSADYLAYFMFQVTGLNSSVQSAKLSLFVSDGSNDGGGIYLVVNNYEGTTTPWDESGLNWNNAPQISGTALSALGAVIIGSTVEFDVTAAISGDGVYSFAVKNGSSDAAKYHSKEGANPPQLMITTGSSSSDAPVIASFLPMSGPVGTVVTIVGNHFGGTTNVSFGGVLSSNFGTVSDTQITATVPDGVITGKIQVTTAEGTAISTDVFTVTIPAPVITHFTPSSGEVGTLVTITGANFTGTTSTRFNGVSATFSVESGSEIRATVPAGASTGKITVTTAAGTATSADDFTVTTPPPEIPVITHFTPSSGLVGMTVTITGSHFAGAIDVRFGGIAASDFEVVSDTLILAIVPDSATTGKISVTTAPGTGTSADDFTVTPPPPEVPVITNFMPASGPVGTTVTITGSHFTGTTAVTFNSVAAQFEFVLDGELNATVPPDATTGQINITSPAGTGTSSTDFVVTIDGGQDLRTQIFNPTDDTFVWSSKPSNNYGSSEDLRVRKTSQFQIAYFKFDVTGLSGSVISVKLRLLCNDGSINGGGVYLVFNNFLNSSTPWTESGLLWTNAPAVSGTALASVGAVSVGQTVEFDVSAAINADGVFSFAVSNHSTDVVYFSSKEGAQSPELIITTGSGSDLAKESEGFGADESPIQSIIIPESLTLLPNYPNPFNAGTTIEYTLPEAAEVHMKVYNIRGQAIRELVNEFQTAGFKQVRWDGSDDQGAAVGSGVYFVMLRAGNQQVSKEVTLQK